MSSTGHMLRTSSALRLMCFLLAIVLLFVALSARKWKFHVKAVIDSLSPQVGTGGDTVTITGNHFGAERADSTVIFGGYTLTQSSYLTWTDNVIVLKLPLNVSDGLVFVQTPAGVSNPAFFANAQNVPVPVLTSYIIPPPVISSLSPASLRSGDVLTISGTGFGNGNSTNTASNGQCRVLFESAGVRLAASDGMNDIERWTDTEIKVRVVDGATSGTVTIENSGGTSEPHALTVLTDDGGKHYGERRTYLVQLSADINDTSATSPSHIRLYFPRPVVSSSQYSAEMTERVPDIDDEDYQGTSLRTLKIDKGGKGKTRYSETYAITVRAVSVTVNNPLSMPSRSTMNARLFDTATSADSCIPSSDSRISSLAQDLVGTSNGSNGENNSSATIGAYNIARTIYQAMISRYKLTETKFNKCEPLSMLSRGNGDAYDFAVIYTALLRAAGVPALPCNGIIVDKDKTAKPHWWSTFYVNGAGWVPVDIALDATSGQDTFGTLDAQHITFSCGFHTMKNFARQSNVVQRPKSYALQSIWEESTKDTRRYSSFWSDPIVLGVY